MSYLKGDLEIKKRDDGSGGNLSVEGTLTANFEGLTFETTITGDGITTDFFIAHNLESRSLVTAIYDAEGNQTDALVTCTSLNNVVVSFGVAPENGEFFKIVLIK